MAPDLTVQVVNYRTRDHLGPCLQSVLDALGQTAVASRLAVLDNASGDDLRALQARHAGAVDFHQSERNLGFGGGHNLLASTHASPLLCFVNPDVVADQAEVFSRLLEALDDERAAVAGPLLRTPAGDPQRFDHGELRGVRAVVANRAGHAHWQARTERTEVAWVSGAFLLVRRAAFDAAGGFDERFFLYKEEEDLCLRIRRAGGRVLYVPEAQARHEGSVVAGREPAQLAASDTLYAEKHLSPMARRVYGALYRNVTRRI